MSNEAMVIDYKYCTGCHACEISCQNEKGLKDGEWGMKLTEHGPKKLNGKWFWDYVPVPSKICDLCVDRRAEGKVAPCTLHCLAQCMQIVAIEDLPAILADMGEEVAVFIP